MISFWLLHARSSLVYPEIIRVNDTIEERGMVQKILKPNQIEGEFLKVNPKSDPVIRNAGLESVAFITPWNRAGYNLTLEFGHKFTVVSPTWFRISPTEFGGEDVVNVEWMEELRRRWPHIKIAPRVLCSDLWYHNGYSLNRDFMSKISKQFKEAAAKYKFDGAVVEFTGSPRDGYNKFIPALTKAFRKCLGGRKSYLAMAMSNPVNFYEQREVLSYLKPLTEYFDLVLFASYEVASIPGISSLELLEQTDRMVAGPLRAFTKKIAIGFPFYGLDFVTSNYRYVFAEDILNMIDFNNVIIRWLPNYGEHVMFFKEESKQHTVHFPTPLFLKIRLQKIIELGYAGVSYWELAQGFPCLFDLM